MTEELKISDNSFWSYIEKTFKNTGGVYELFCQYENEVQPVARLLTTDPQGILYICKADYFLDRVIELKKSISPNHNSSNHECGVRWKRSNAIMQKFPYRNLWVRLTSAERPRSLELEKLKLYEERYGELPPLNRVG